MNPPNPNDARPPRDWKGNAGLLLNICGLVLPIGLWLYDLSATSISTKVISSVSLSTKLPAVDDIEVRLGGRPLTEPYVSTIVIANDGAKPIPTASFEVPLEFFAAGVTLVRAKLALAEPEELSPRIGMEANSFRVEPLLLNQGDEIKVVVITEGGQPRFKIKGRVNSVRKLELTDETQPRPDFVKNFVRVFTFLFGTLLYPLATVMVLRKARPPFWLLCGLTLTALWASTRNAYYVSHLFEISRLQIMSLQYGSILLIFVIAFKKMRLVRY